MAKGVPDPEYILRGNNNAITSVLFYRNESDRFIISGSQDGYINVWCLKKRHVLHSWQAHKQSVLSLTVLHVNTLLSQGRDGFIHFWKLSEVGWIKEGESLICDAAGFCPLVTLRIEERTLVIVPNNKPSVTDIIDIGTREAIGSLIPNGGPTKHGMCMIMCAVNDSSILIGYEDGSLLLWDIIQKKELANVKLYSDSVMSVCYSDVIKKGIVGSVNDTISVFQYLSDNKISVTKSITITNPGVNCIRIRSDGKLFATGGWDGNVRIFSCKKNNLLAVLSFHSQSIQCLDFDIDHNLAVGSRDGAISVWSLYK